MSIKMNARLICLNARKSVGGINSHENTNENALKEQDIKVENIKKGWIDGKFCFYILKISCVFPSATRRAFDSLLFSPCTNRLSQGMMRSHSVWFLMLIIHKSSFHFWKMCLSSIKQGCFRFRFCRFVEVEDSGESLRDVWTWVSITSWLIVGLLSSFELHSRIGGQ